MQYAGKISAWRRELNTRRGKAANTPGLRSRQIHSHAQAAVIVARLDGSFKDKGFCVRSVCQLREKNLISVSSSVCRFVVAGLGAVAGASHVGG